VIISTRTPARRHAATASSGYGRGGSSIPLQPQHLERAEHTLDVLRRNVRARGKTEARAVPARRADRPRGGGVRADAVRQQNHRRSFDVEHRATVGPLVDGRHKAPFAVERKRGDALQPPALDRGVQPCPFGDRQERDLGGVPQHGVCAQRRVVAKHPGAQQLHDLGRHRSVGVLGRELNPAVGDPEGLDGHFVARESAGLVRRHHRGAAEGPDRGQVTDDRAPPRHPLHADRQCDRDHGGQSFGDGGNRQADPRQRRIGRGNPRTAATSASITAATPISA
jgi:hypothetical protein